MKPQILWAIFSGKTLMPFTIRSTRRQCISDFVKWTYTKRGLNKNESCRKVIITEYKKGE